MKDIEILKNIPQIMKLEAVWCCWKYINNEQGDLIKKPFNPLTGYGAKSNDKSTFVSWPTLARYFNSYYEISDEGKMLGGAGLGIFNDYSAIDIDHCVDNNGTISEMAQDIINYCGSYTELSPSGSGIRIIFKTNTKINKSLYYINNSKRGLEIYISNNTNKFVTITGNKISGDDIATIDIQPVLDKYMKRDTPLVGISQYNETTLDDALQHDDKLRELWTNQAPGSHANESELDMALACKLAYYIPYNLLAIKQAFESSPYFNSKDNLHKNKWLETDYAIGTINGAISFVGSNTILNKVKPAYNPEPVKDNEPVKVESMPAAPIKYGLNDVGNAHRFADKFINNIKYNVDNETWMLWNMKYWETDIKGKIRDYIDLLVADMEKDYRNEQDDVKRKLIAKNIEKLQNKSGRDSLLSECQHVDNIPVLNSDFDVDDYLVCGNNMIYDLINQRSLTFERNLMISQCLACDIDLEHEPTRFIQFLYEICDNDEEMVRYIRKVLAYCMSGSTIEQQMWVFYGDGNNGKSLLLDIFYEMLGGYGITSRPELLVDAKNGNTTQEEVARLKGKRATIMEEIKDGDRANESLLKQFTSGVGKMTGRFLYGNTFEFTMKAKILMASNYKFKIKGVDKGIWRRVNLIPLNRDFSNVADKNLKDKLMQELPQIAGWLCKGYALYLKEGLDNKPAKVADSTKEYKEESDIVQTWINENCDITNPKVHIKSSELFKDFVYWCKDNQEIVMSQTAFGRNMVKKFKRTQLSDGKYYTGIQLRVDKVKHKELEYEYADVKINEKDI